MKNDFTIATIHRIIIMFSWSKMYSILRFMVLKETKVFRHNTPDNAVIITIIPCPQIISANMNPDEIQISSLKVPLLKDVVIAKICPRVCSVLKYATTKFKKESNTIKQK